MSMEDFSKISQLQNLIEEKEVEINNVWNSRVFCKDFKNKNIINSTLITSSSRTDSKGFFIQRYLSNNLYFTHR